eukprot:4709374-Pleurochrysis_carterae.AAC.1
MLQEIDTTAIGNGRAAWAILQGQHGRPPRTGLTNIDDDSQWSSLRLSDVGIDERTITKIVAKITKSTLSASQPASVTRSNAASSSCR